MAKSEQGINYSKFVGTLNPNHPISRKQFLGHFVDSVKLTTLGLTVTGIGMTASGKDNERSQTVSKDKIEKEKVNGLVTFGGITLTAYAALQLTYFIIKRRMQFEKMQGKK